MRSNAVPVLNSGRTAKAQRVFSRSNCTTLFETEPSEAAIKFEFEFEQAVSELVELYRSVKTDSTVAEHRGHSPKALLLVVETALWAMHGQARVALENVQEALRKEGNESRFLHLRKFESVHRRMCSFSKAALGEALETVKD